MINLNTPRAPNWSPREDAKLLALRKRGLTLQQIAEQLTGRTPAAVRTRMNVLGLSSSRRGRGVVKISSDKCQRFLDGMRSPTSEARASSRSRPCLCCKRPFNSKGPGNRLCTECRHVSVSPYEP